MANPGKPQDKGNKATEESDDWRNQQSGRSGSSQQGRDNLQRSTELDSVPDEELVDDVSSQRGSRQGGQPGKPDKTR